MNVIITWLLPLLALFGCSTGFDDWDQFELVWEDNFDTLDLNKWQYEISAWGGNNSEFQVYANDPVNCYVTGGRLHIKPTLLAENINPQTGEPFGTDFMENGVLDMNELFGACTQPEVDGCYRTGADGNIPPVMSAKLVTYDRFSFTFGRAVIRAKMPVGDWLWPAIWMLPENFEYGPWPQSGEIDINEYIGNRDYVTNTPGGGVEPLGIQKMGSTLHWGSSRNANRYYLTSTPLFDYNNNFGDFMHTYILDWSPNGLRVLVDNQDVAFFEVPSPQIDQNPNWTDFWTYGGPWPTGEPNPWVDGTNMAPFDRDFHFILNVAVGGTVGFIPEVGINRGGVPEYQKPWSNSQSYVDAMKSFYDSRENWKWTWDSEGENAAMQIDSIQVYQKIRAGIPHGLTGLK